MDKLARDPNHTGSLELFTPDIDPLSIRAQVKEVVKELKESINLTQAKTIVSGGRGLATPEGFALLNELALAIGGCVASSRACVDAGWIDKSRQVGQTGSTVKPDLYIACGISGAIQHLAGMQESGFIVAINKNESAPIMNVADIGIVGDLYQVIPEMLRQLRELEG
jgi:electron transfer flavoprotein alpha subunit